MYEHVYFQHLGSNALAGVMPRSIHLYARYSFNLCGIVEILNGQLGLLVDSRASSARVSRIKGQRVCCCSALGRL